MSACARRRLPRIGRRGATSVELALVASLLVSLLIGAVELGRYMATLQGLGTATAEAVRLATLRGGQNLAAGQPGCTNLSGSLAGAAAHSPFLVPARLTVTLSGCATQWGITRVTVTATYPFAFAVGTFGALNRPMSETAQAVFN